MENRGGTDDEMSRQMWKEMEDRKVDKTRMEKAARKGRKEGNEKANNR